MSYRPITDVWILARPKVKYYGAYPAGFLHRARQLLGVGPNDPVLHVCGGRVRDYPYRGLGPNDKTLDISLDTNPDFLQLVQAELPRGFAAILADPPYTENDAVHYGTEEFLPSPSWLLRHCLESVEPGRRVGMLHYKWPHPGKLGQEVAVVGVGTGRNQSARWFTVFERL